jgi:hypothetical protein
MVQAWAGSIDFVCAADKIPEGTSEIMRHNIARDLVRSAQRANDPEGTMS